ncbi:cytochrome c oxidase subunit 4 [Cryobacterium sp. SO2]|uniref:cytochrome c oxidase subunit 4 n=1 Tax=Cryobacterium sp. SO2 TaxID=1897060 RepID=UPI00223DEAD1|nr:cytochrome c oxidase subunit 4 [Cryobacterium sp. SO2]WEO76313.1 cytochrome c oxidase subunit 4 [Cryobacterium sp. SO2]
MGANVRLFWVLAGFFLVADVAYTVWNLIVYAQHVNNPGASTQTLPPVDWVGTVVLGLTFVLAAFIAFYLGRVHKAQGGELPQDNVNGNIDDDDPELGFYSPFSWWPILVAASLALVFLGLAVGVWISIIGVGVGLIALVGWTYEYYRGFFAR